MKDVLLLYLSAYIEYLSVIIVLINYMNIFIDIFINIFREKFYPSEL
jgi:hypothetical protein